MPEAPAPVSSGKLGAEKIISDARQSRVDKCLACFVALPLRHPMPLMNGVRKQHACGNDR
jgi:hypothetical protein